MTTASLDNKSNIIVLDSVEDRSFKVNNAGVTATFEKLLQDCKYVVKTIKKGQRTFLHIVDHGLIYVNCRNYDCKSNESETFHTDMLCVTDLEQAAKELGVEAFLGTVFKFEDKLIWSLADLTLIPSGVPKKSNDAIYRSINSDNENYDGTVYFCTGNDNFISNIENLTRNSLGPSEYEDLCYKFWSYLIWMPLTV